MSVSQKQSNVPNFQNVDIKGQKHKRQENVNKSGISTRTSSKEGRYSESWPVRSSGRENDVSQDDVIQSMVQVPFSTITDENHCQLSTVHICHNRRHTKEPSSRGKQTNLFYRSLHESSWYHPSSDEETWIDSDSEDEDSQEEEEEAVKILGLRTAPNFKRRADRAGAHGHNSSSFAQLKSSQMKRGLSEHTELMDISSYFEKPKFSSTKLSQNSRSGKRKNVKFDTNRHTSSLTDGRGRKHHQGSVTEIHRRGKEEAENGESWYNQRLVDIPLSDVETDWYSRNSEVVTFEKYAALKSDQRVGSKKFSAKGPNDSGRESRDLLNQAKSLHSLDKKLTGEVVRKGSSKVRHEVLSDEARTDHFTRLETSASEPDSQKEACLGSERTEGHFTEDISVFEFEEIGNTNFLTEEYKVWLHAPSNSGSLKSPDRGTQGSCDDAHIASFDFCEKGSGEEVDRSIGEGDLMSSLQDVDSVQHLLLQYEKDLDDLSIPYGVKGFNEEFELGEAKSFPKGGLEYFDEHYYHNPILSPLESASRTLSNETGLHDEDFKKAQALQAQFPSCEQMGSKHLQDFVTAQDFTSEISSLENRVLSRLGLEEATVERMVSDVILSQSEVMSQLVESSPNTTKSPGRTERSSMSCDVESISVPHTEVDGSRQSWTNFEDTLDSLEITSTRGTEPSHHGHKHWDSIAVQTGHNDSVSLSLQELSTQNRSGKAETRSDLTAFSRKLERIRKENDDREGALTFNSVDSLLLSRNPKMSSMDRTTNTAPKYSMQKSSVFLEKHMKPKSATSKQKQQLEKTVLNEESSLHRCSESNLFPNSILHSGMSLDKSRDQKFAKKSLKFDLSQENVKSKLASDHHDQAKLKEEPLVHSSHSECIQQAVVSLDSLKFSLSSRFQELCLNESSNSANVSKGRDRLASFPERETGNRIERPFGEIENRSMNLSEGTKSSGKSLTSESSFSNASKFPTLSKARDFTQSLHLSELGTSDLEGGGKDVDEAAESRREDGEKGIVDSESHDVQRHKTKYQGELWKMQYDQRGQYDRRTVMNDETDVESGIKLASTFHPEASSSTAKDQRERNESRKAQVGYDHEGQYGSRTLFHNLSGNSSDKPVRSSYSQPTVVNSKRDPARPNDVSKEFRGQFVEKCLKTGSKKERLKKDPSGQTEMLSSVHCRPKTPNRSLLQDVTLLSGLGWTTRVRNVLRETPKKERGDMVSKAYWLKRWRISTRVQKMLRAEEEGQMHSAILFHEVSLLHKYLTAWKTIPRRKQHRALKFHQKCLLRKGMRALQTSVREREAKVKCLEERIQHSQMRSSFLKWHSLARRHQDNGLIAVRYSERNGLVFAFHKWREKFGMKQKERISNLHYKLHLLSSHFANWKIYVSDRRVRKEQNKLARVFYEENMLQVSWKTLKIVYHKRLAAQRQDRRCLLGKVIRSWRHGAKLSRLETIEDHHKAQEFRRSSLLRTYLVLWREEVVISKARRKLEVVSLRFAFDLWKLKLERKNLVTRIVASKLRRAAKLRALCIWKKKTHENRERRIEGIRILETFVQRWLFQAWKKFVKERTELRSKALLWNHQSHLRSKMQVFIRWRSKTQGKQQLRALEEHKRQLLVEKFVERWRHIVKVKQDEIKVQIFQQKRRLHIVKAAFNTWVTTFDQTVKDQQRAAEAQETLAQNKFHRTFLSWRLVAREGTVFKPLLQKRRLKMMSSIFTSWHKLAQQKKTALQMHEQKNHRTSALAYYAWRQKYLGILQQRIVAQSHERNHLQRVFRAWHLVSKRKKLAEKFALGCKEEVLKRSFVEWKEKTGEMEMRRERARGSEAREIILKKTYLRVWLRKIREQRDEEGFLCSRISEMQERHLLMTAYCQWKCSHHREIQVREHKKAAVNRKMKMILSRWHQYAKYSFQRSLELFTHSLQMTFPRAYSEVTSDISRLAVASESSHFSDTQQFSVVDSGYHGNHATQTGPTMDGIYIQATSDEISATEFSDADIMSYQSFKTFSEENENSVSSSPRHSGTVKCYEYSSSQSFMQLGCTPSLEETHLLEGEQFKFANSYSVDVSTSEEKNANEGNSSNGNYVFAEEELVSSITRNEYYQQHWSVAIQSSSNVVELSSEPGTSMKALSNSASSETGASSSSSLHLCTVKYHLLEGNALRDIWLGEVGERSDRDSLGEMSIRELEELDEEDGERGDMPQEDEKFPRGTVQTSRAELLTYMIKFWRLWPASAAFLQWLAYTTYRNTERQKIEKFSNGLEKRRFQRCFQVWKKRSELSARARKHEETLKLRRYFGALRDYHCVEKRQREDNRLATRWRYERSLADSFHCWKLRVLKIHTVGVIVPSWEQYIDKARLLHVRAADWTQMVQSKNVQECFIFWKLRFWQQVQVRAHHERILKLRHFRAWLQWIQIRKWRCIQQDKFLQRRQKSLTLARWREALHEKSKVEMMRSKINQNYLREILITWHQYSRITGEDRIRTEEMQCVVRQGTLRQYWNVWRGCLGNLMKAERHRDEILMKRSFVCWSEWTQQNAILQEAVIQVRNISQKKILKLSFTYWQQRLEAKRKLVLLMQQQQLGLVKVYFMRWKEFVERSRQEKKRQRELMQQVVSQWISICTHGKKTRDLAQQSLHRWHQLVIRSQQLSQLGCEFTKRTNDRYLQACWKRWKDASQKWKTAEEFWESSSKKCFFTRWSSLTLERKKRLAKLDHFQAEHKRKLVVQCFQSWKEQFSHVETSAEVEVQFRGQRSQRLLAHSFKFWLQKFYEHKAERHHQESLERKVWLVWRTSLVRSQKIEQFRNDCQRKQLETAFRILQKWTSDQRTRHKLMSDCLEKRNISCVKEAFISWKRQTNQLQRVDDIYHRHILKRNFRAWCDFHRKKKQLNVHAVDAQATFAFNQFMQSLPWSKRFVTVDSVRGNGRDVCNQRLKVCFKIWKVRLSARETERQRVKMLTQRAVDRWKEMVKMRRYQRQVEDELEVLAGRYHSQRLRRAVFVAWRQEAGFQKHSREREEYLSQKFGNLWLKITSQRIIAEQMDRYWTLKKRWLRWRKVSIQSEVSKKFLKDDEANLCLEVFLAWKNAAEEGILWSDQ